MTRKRSDPATAAPAVPLLETQMPSFDVEVKADAVELLLTSRSGPEIGTRPGCGTPKASPSSRRTSNYLVAESDFQLKSGPRH